MLGREIADNCRGAGKKVLVPGLVEEHGGEHGGQGGEGVACKTGQRAGALGRVGTGWCGTGDTVAGTYLGQRTRKRESVRRV